MIHSAARCAAGGSGGDGMRVPAQTSKRSLPAAAARSSTQDASRNVLNAPSAPATFGFDFSRLPAHAPVPLQAKLAIGDTDTPLEREADRVADQVVHMPEQSA